MFIFQGPFGLFLFHWNKVCTSENPQKSEKKSERAPWPCSSGTFHWNIFFLPKSYFLQFGSAVLLLSQIANEKYRDFCSSGMFQWNKKSDQALIYIYYIKKKWVIINYFAYYLEGRHRNFTSFFLTVRFPTVVTTKKYTAHIICISQCQPLFLFGLTKVGGSTCYI